ncbi:hypothetical protein [Nocardia brasiliensis]|uniref:hypothetical protein n=1 Tax=Nocardia brasiliensis TaxID=37326 RepID=UPI0024567D57|nr:hypothetical protein [Nocardia brasiliensis]
MISTFRERKRAIRAGYGLRRHTTTPHLWVLYRPRGGKAVATGTLTQLGILLLTRLADPSAEQRSPHPDQPDVHLAVTLGGVRLDYAACVTCALWFVQDNNARHCLDQVDVIPGAAAGLPRLPNERLYEQ